MFGFGDDKNPYTESVDLLEDMVVEYISEMVSTVDVPNFPTLNACQKGLEKQCRSPFYVLIYMFIDKLGVFYANQKSMSLDPHLN